MTEFKGNSEDGFGIIGFFSHFFISLSVLLVVFALPAWFISGGAELFGLLLGVGGAGVFTGIGLGFLNMFL